MCLTVSLEYASKIALFVRCGVVISPGITQDGCGRKLFWRSPLKLLQIKSNVLSDFLRRRSSPQLRVSTERQQRGTFSEDKYHAVNLTSVVL